jgi:propionyl-CoA synthetase
MAQFNSLFQQSINKPEEFWAEAAAGIDWIKQWEQVLDSARPPFYRWFAGATMNTCYNAVDRHVETGRGEQTAIIYDSPVTNTVRKVTYSELQDNVARFAGGLKNLGVNKGDVFWSASDVGWVVGHSYIIYGPLFKGATTIIYEGKPVGTPDAGAFWRVIAEHKVKTMFTAPTAFRAIKKMDPEGKLIDQYDMSSFEALYLAGERLDPDTYHWAGNLLNVPIIDHWWQTETGWAIVANCRGIEEMEVKPGSPSLPVPGYDVRVVNNNGEELPPGVEGNIVVKLPLPPGTLATLWRNEDRFLSSYMTTFPGYYETSDGGFIDKDGYVFVMGRMDDVINIAGHRLSTGSMEEVLATHPDVAECAVIGTNDQLKGQLPLGLFVLKEGVDRDPEAIKAELVKMVREEIGAIACLRETSGVNRLPKTRSGKILRGTMRSIANGKAYNMPSTIDDPTSLDEITAALKDMGYPKK